MRPTPPSVPPPISPRASFATTLRPAPPTLRARVVLCVVTCAALAACGAADAGADAEPATPPNGGDVWEADRAEDRAHAAATMVAFVNGVHALVVDGDDAYAGMTRLRATRGPDGARTLPLANGLSAELAPVGEVMELRFSSGETVPMRRQPDRAPR